MSRQADEPTDEEVEAAAEAIFTHQYPSFQYVGDDWARDYARVALVAAAEARACAPTPRLEPVRELHRPVDVEPSDTICGECSLQLPNGHYFGKIVEWPCPTLRAMEADA